MKGRSRVKQSQIKYLESDDSYENKSHVKLHQSEVLSEGGVNR